MTTVEEVFLKVGQRGRVMVDSGTDSNPFPQPTFQRDGESSFVVFWRHLMALLIGRFWLTIRLPGTLFTALVLPFILAVFLLWIALAPALSIMELQRIWYVVNDRHKRTKHQQMVSGLNPTAYWYVTLFFFFFIVLSD